MTEYAHETMGGGQDFEKIYRAARPPAEHTPACRAAGRFGI
jgi:hypothetical protein